MEVKCNGGDLAEAVNKVSKALPSRAVKVEQDSIKLSAFNGTLTLSASDVELSIETMIRASVTAEGEAVVSGKIFSEFVRRLPAEEVTISYNGKMVSINYANTTGAGDFTSYNINDFPAIAQLNNPEFFEIKASDLKDIINRVAFSVCTDDSRPILRGVFFEIAQDSLTAVALDGFRFALCTKPLIETSTRYSIIVPARSVVEISRSIEDIEGNVKVCIQRNYLMVKLNSTTITTRLCDGDFIDYHGIIPKMFEAELTVAKDAFSTALQRAVLISHSESNNYAVKFDIRGDSIAISSSGNAGNFNEVLPCNFVGDELTIFFNAKYIIEILRYIEGESVKLKFTDSMKQCEITSTASDESLYVIMPIRSFC